MHRSTSTLHFFGTERSTSLKSETTVENDDVAFLLEYKSFADKKKNPKRESKQSKPHDTGVWFPQTYKSAIYYFADSYPFLRTKYEYSENAFKYSKKRSETDTTETPENSRRLTV